MADLQGVMHKIAFVDLSSGDIKIETPEDALYENYLGGYGIGAYLIYNRQKANVDALAAEAMFGITTGPLTGTDAITGNRFTAVGKSPKTGTWGDANCGGNFGPAMKMAGFDAVYFTGMANEPVYLMLEDGKVAIESAKDYWGLDCTETEDKFEESLGKDVRLACVGPSGERGSLLAAIMNNKGRAAGRSALGTVMGVKRIKAVVARPTLDRVPVADPDGLKQLRREILAEHYQKGNESYELFSDYGTCGITDNACTTGDTPIKNWGGVPGDFPNSSKISDDQVIAIQTRKYACWRCPLGCGGHVKVESGPYAVEGHKPEYETLGVFGAMCLNDNLESIAKVNDICNRAGLDTISTGATVAFAIECYENGVITRDDTGGIELTWGNHEAIVAITDQIAKGEGFGGEVLALGSKAAAAKIGPGAAPYAMHVQGEELPMHDPRCSPGLGASYVIDATPGRHTQFASWFEEGGFVPPDLGHPPIEDKYNYSGKGETHKYISNWGHVVNSSGLCMFGSTVTPGDAVPKFLNLAMGLNLTMADTLTIGERIANLRMAFNFREGARNLTFSVPVRMIGEPPLEAGPLKGVTVDYRTEIKDYLEAMDWDTETGKPRKEKLEQLGLDFVEI